MLYYKKNLKIYAKLHIFLYIKYKNYYYQLIYDSYDSLQVYEPTVFQFYLNEDIDWFFFSFNFIYKIH